MADAATSSNDSNELDEIMGRLQSHKGVEGILILNKEGKTIQSTLSEEQTLTHGGRIGKLASRATSLIESLDETDELTFLRIKSKHREILVSPDKSGYLLVVIQNPNASE
eukprot:scaffold51591_cov53-Attheya_sp.AAC.2